MNGRWYFLWLANLVAVTHGIVVVSVVVGAVAALTGALRHHPCWERGYYALLAAVIVSGLLFDECFLTTWEKALRNWHWPGSAYRHSFLGQYCPLLSPKTVLSIGGVLITSAFLAFPFWRWVDAHRMPRAKTSGLTR